MIYRISASTCREPVCFSEFTCFTSTTVQILTHRGASLRYVPGTPPENYAWVIYGKFQITLAGTYQFCSTSDDGSFLFVDDMRIVNNDGLHGAVRVCGSVGLTAGLHDIKVPLSY